MSIVKAYREKKELLKSLQEEVDQLSKQEDLQKELEFEKKLRDLMNEYQRSLPDIIGLLDPSLLPDKARATKSATAGKRTRRIKQYKNPHTGDVIETKGGNHKTLKEWKAEWGNEAVESWATVLD